MQNYQLRFYFGGNEHLIEQHFFNTDLGKLYRAIPFEELASKIAAPRKEKSGLGRNPVLTVKGGIGLMILKHYLNLSDQKLLERLKTDWSMRLFCSVPINKTIRSKNLVWQWRKYLGQHMDIDALQKEAARHWKPFMNETQVGMSDATVFESYIRHPNDVVLLWQSCEWVFDLISLHCKQNKIRKPRIRFQKQYERYISYQRKRRKGARRTRRIRHGLTKFLVRLLGRMDELGVQTRRQKDTQRLSIIRALCRQQYEKMMNPEGKIKNRIVSLHKPYVRPIVRGKEVKAVEFGAKVNLLQVDGINFIEHISYDAFNEGTRMISSIRKHRSYFGACHQFGADAIYGTNANRKYCSKNKIATCFVRKGKPSEHEEQSRAMRSQLGKQRATVLEGSFGNEKNHYLLSKIKAKNQPCELAWIFFGIFTANAVQMSKRMDTSQRSRRAA
jgi:IS5 family transposase